MSFEGDVQRKIRQLDNDVQSIYELLAGISLTQTRHSNRFEELQATLDTVGQDLDTRVDAVRQELRLTRRELETKLEGVRQEVGATRQQLEGRLERVEGRFEGVEAKLDTVIRLVGGQAG